MHKSHSSVSATRCDVCEVLSHTPHSHVVNTTMLPTLSLSMLACPACMGHKSRTPMWRLLTSPCVSWPHTRAASPSEPPQGVPLSTPLSLRCYATQARQAALPSHALACMLGGPASTNRVKSTPFSPLPLITRQRSRGCPALCLTRALAVRRTLRAPPPRPAIHRGRRCAQRT